MRPRARTACLYDLLVRHLPWMLPVDADGQRVGPDSGIHLQDLNWEAMRRPRPPGLGDDGGYEPTSTIPNLAAIAAQVKGDTGVYPVNIPSEVSLIGPASYFGAWLMDFCWTELCVRNRTTRRRTGRVRGLPQRHLQGDSHSAWPRTAMRSSTPWGA